MANETNPEPAPTAPLRPQAPSGAAPAPRPGGSLPAIAVLTVLLVGGGTVIWGWPGVYALAALVPAIFLGVTFAHLLSARGTDRFRPGVIAFGAFFGLATTGTAIALFAAAAHPGDFEHAVTRTAEGTPSLHWGLAGDPARLAEWSPWVIEADPIGRGGPPEVGGRYRVTLQVQAHRLSAEIVVTEVSPPETIAWKLEMPGDSYLSGLEERVTLTPSGDGTSTAFAYRMTYRVASAIDRLKHGFAARGFLHEVATRSAEGLAGAAAQR